MRLCGLQLLETWLTRLESLQKTQTQTPSSSSSGSSSSAFATIPLKLTWLSLLLTKSWNHPGKMINQMVPKVYEQVVNLFHAIDQRGKDIEFAHTTASIGTGTGTGGGGGGGAKVDHWRDFLAHALDQPVKHRGPAFFHPPND